MNYKIIAIVTGLAAVYYAYKYNQCSGAWV